MAGALEWLLKLKDGISGPAGAMASKVGGLTGALGSLGNAASSIESTFKTLKDSVLGDIAAEAGKLIVAGAQLAIDASSFKEDTIISLKHLLGSQDAAVEVFDRIDDLAGRLAISDEQAVGQLKKLLAAGFSADTALGVVEAAANLAAARGQESADAFTNLISTIEAKGKFDVGAIGKLAKAGVRAEDVYAQLAKTLHKTVPEVQAMVKAGQIDAATGTDAAVAVIKAKFGGAAEEAASTFPKLLFRLKDALGDLFQDVDLGPLKDALKGILDAVNGPAGAELKAGISKFFGEIFKVIGSLFSGPEGARRLQETLHSAARAFEMAAQVITAVGPIIVAVVGAVIDILNLANQGRDGIGDWGQSIVDAFSAAGAAIAAFVMIPVAAFLTLWDAIVGVVGAIVDTVVGLPDSIGAAIGGVGDSLSADASGIGTSIIDGLVSGILNGAAAVIAAITGVAQGAINAAVGILKIGSPSQVFADLGHFTAEGFGQGLAANDSPQTAVEGMLDTPTVQAAAAAGTSAGRGAPAPAAAGGPKVVQINIHGGDTDRVRRTVVEVLEAAGWT